MISDPDSLADLTPDYVQGNLDAETTAAFTERLNVDPALRRELDEFLALKSLYRQTQDEFRPPSEPLFQRITAAINETNASPADLHRSSRRLFSPGRGRLAPVLSWFRDSVGLPWAVAIAQTALIVFLLLPGQPDPSYQTLSVDRDIAAGAGNAVYNIVFAESASAGQIKRLLVEANGSIVEGPSAEGRYRVVFPDDDNRQERDARLRRDTIVRFLEPAMD